MSPINISPRSNSSLTVDLSAIPDGWFLWALYDDRTRITYAGEKHQHQYWTAALQWADGGGRLVKAHGVTPRLALDLAIERAIQWPRTGLRYIEPIER